MEKFDTVIIGAGIGGLVAGCYLSKAGLKVLIVEQHYKPGGYCTSFERNGYDFDVGVHYFGGIKKGILGKIFKELNLISMIKLHQFDPTDKLVLPDNITFVRANANDTIKEFKISFPKEKNNIDKFFKYILNSNFLKVYSEVKGMTFEKLLDAFFIDFRLKATLGVLLSNIGTAPNKAAAFPCIVLFRQYILDPGYYPRDGGIQKLPNALLNIFSKHGGQIIFSKKITKILTKKSIVIGVEIDGQTKIKANSVLSNADVIETMNKLLDIKSKESNTIQNMTPSPSMFIVYLGLKDIDLNKNLGNNSNIYYFSSYDVNKYYSFPESKKRIHHTSNSIICSFPSLHSFCLHNKKHTASILKFADYHPKKIWEKHKAIYMEEMIDKLCELIPSLRCHIDIKFAATPRTLSRYTSNHKGAFSGWTTILHHMKSNLLPQKTSIKNLYLAGHWTTTGYLPFGGIPNVAYTGRRCAKLILDDMKKEWTYSEINP
ncbi:MAG: NAD(P)/FAD-dependent oxidoreductase [Candidatus Omnitrophica bacterium]|nr:NAD(P)/FAD-dependent oxidoreductase [Candidatus Omnitrophota bacterium]